jgi:hypothetical protein
MSASPATIESICLIIAATALLALSKTSGSSRMRVLNRSLTRAKVVTRTRKRASAAADADSQHARLIHAWTTSRR